MAVRFLRARSGRDCIRVLCAAFGIVVFLCSDLAWAAPPSAGEFKKLQEEAATLLEKGRLPEAFAKFQQIYAWTQAPWDTCNLGRTAYRMRAWVEAFAFLTTCNEAAYDPRRLELSDQKILTEAKDQLEKVQKYVGLLRVTVDKPGADVFVDGKKVGKSPLARDIAVETGVRHRVTAKLGQETGRMDMESAIGGGLYAITITLVAPPTPQPTAPQAEEAPRAPEPPAAPPPAAAPSWPAVLMMAAGGATVAYAAIELGVFVQTMNATADMNRAAPRAKVRGCVGPSDPSKGCAQLFEAYDGVTRAREVSDLASMVALPMASGLLSAGLLGQIFTEAPVKVTPTARGLVLHGTF